MLPNSPVPDSASQRFEDIVFVNPTTGWIAQYSGIIYKTTNAGNNWTNVLTSSAFPFGKFRSLGFFNSQFGLLGTLNSLHPLYRTTNGGTNWLEVNNIPNPVPYGICGMSVVNDSIGYAVGRYAAPANVIKTTDRGASWTSIIMDPSLVRSLVDCYFWSADSGIVVGGFNTSTYASGNAVIMKTTNGGVNWQRTFISSRSGEWCWKISFINKTTGYVSIERHSGFAYILKTTNAGASWTEKPFMEYDEEGIGFVNENTGWIGGWTGPTYETTNGGNNWNQVNWGYYVNRFRFINDTIAYAVGDRVYKYSPEVVPVFPAKFAVIGDYGKAGIYEQSVSQLVSSRTPEYVLTLGNNNFNNGADSTIDNNIGQYYSSYIHPYSGSYGTGDTVNRFFPSLGNIDWLTAGAAPYLNYFTLPGNERYYDFVKGNVHFFCIDSDPSEPDGRDSNSVQAQWLKTSLALSSQKWNVVYFNNPPYSSGSDFGYDITMRWPFKSWGASVVLSGRENIYERLIVGGLPYIVNGLGGQSKDAFGSAVSGSQVRYSNNYGALFGYESGDTLIFRFINTAGNQIDKINILMSSKTLTMKYLIEGLYNPVTDRVTGDQVTVLLRSYNFPYQVIDSIKGFVSQFGVVTSYFSKIENNRDFYIVVKHKNSLETWSSNANKFTLNSLNYDFSLSAGQAYGNNLILKGTKYCSYSGDVNQDGVIESTDLSLVDNEINSILPPFGTSVADLNNDYTVDATDLSIVDNNASVYISVIKP
jgi:photosystem II stability/assembly factor-like uncharacterized protein